MTKRIFVSVDLPGEIKEKLKLLQKPEIRWIKWMKPENLHITLNFLGELDEEKIEQAKKVMEDTLPYYQPFNLAINRAVGERDMLWLVPEEEPKLFELQKELSEKFREARARKRERRRYIPHVLWAKSKTGRPMTWKPDEFSARGGSASGGEPLTFTVDRINLYESQLTPGAATHILIQTFPMTP